MRVRVGRPPFFGGSSSPGVFASRCSGELVGTDDRVGTLATGAAERRQLAHILSEPGHWNRLRLEYVYAKLECLRRFHGVTILQLENSGNREREIARLFLMIVVKSQVEKRVLYFYTVSLMIVKCQCIAYTNY